MEKLIATAVAVALFCLFAVSLALTPSENDDATTAVGLPLSVNTIIRLPTEGVKADESATATDTATSAPSTEVTFQPIDRHHLEVLDPRTREHEETPYGDDMMVPSGENSDFDDLGMIHEGSRRWVTLHRHNEASDSDSDSDDDDEDDHDHDDGSAFGYYGFDRKKLKALAKMKNFGVENEKEDEQKNGGFMQRVRKVLGHYF